MDDFYKSFDARVWAREFIRILKENPNITIDEELMTAWFADALMRGYDEQYWKSKEYKRMVRKATIPWWKRIFVPLKNFGR